MTTTTNTTTTTTNIPETYADALADGYYVYDWAWTRGYMSRKTDIDDHMIQVAGGRRSGELFVEVPATTSTQYHLRKYLKQREGVTS